MKFGITLPHPAGEFLSARAVRESVGQAPAACRCTRELFLLAPPNMTGGSGIVVVMAVRLY